MPPAKLTGPCVLHREGPCRSGSRAFRRITDLAFSKIHPSVRDRHPNLVRNAVVCHGHYMKYVEAGRGGNSRPYWEREKMRILGGVPRSDCFWVDANGCGYQGENGIGRQGGGQWKEAFFGKDVDMMMARKLEKRISGDDCCFSNNRSNCEEMSSRELTAPGGPKKKNNIFQFQKTHDRKSFPMSTQILPRRILPDVSGGGGPTMRRFRELYERGKRPRGRPRNEMNEYVRTGFDPRLFGPTMMGGRPSSRNHYGWEFGTTVPFPSGPSDPPLFHCPTNMLHDDHDPSELFPPTFYSSRNSNNLKSNSGNSFPASSHLSASTSTLNKPRIPPPLLPLPPPPTESEDEDPARLLLLLSSSHNPSTQEINLKETQQHTYDKTFVDDNNVGKKKSSVTLPSIRNFFAAAWPFPDRRKSDDLMLPPPDVYHNQFLIN